MFGSLMMFASGVLASSPSSLSASGTRCSSVSRSGNCARMRPASEMSRSSMSDARLRGERLDDRQQRVRRQRRRLVRVRVDELHRLLFAFVVPGLGDEGTHRRYSERWCTSRSPGICSRPRTSRTCGTASRSASTTWPPRPVSPARTSRASSGASSASPRTRTCSPADSSARPRCCATRTARSPRSASTSASRASAPSRPASSACSAPPRRSTGRSSRRAAARVVVPSCVVRAYARPQHRTFREDSAADAELASCP